MLTGDFDHFKNWMINHATVDIRIQTLMLAWSFGALMEGLVGFGYPWAVVVPILAGLGIADLEALSPHFPILLDSGRLGAFSGRTCLT